MRQGVAFEAPGIPRDRGQAMRGELGRFDERFERRATRLLGPGVAELIVDVRAGIEIGSAATEKPPVGRERLDEGAARPVSQDPPRRRDKRLGDSVRAAPGAHAATPNTASTTRRLSSVLACI
jgi:hypothetical protein